MQSKNISSALFGDEVEGTILGTRNEGCPSCVFNRGYGVGVDIMEVFISP